jgi:hypothetical protein
MAVGFIRKLVRRITGRSEVNVSRQLVAETSNSALKSVTDRFYDIFCKTAELRNHIQNHYQRSLQNYKQGRISATDLKAEVAKVEKLAKEAHDEAEVLYLQIEKLKASPLDHSIDPETLQALSLDAAQARYYTQQAYASAQKARANFSTETSEAMSTLFEKTATHTRNACESSGRVAAKYSSLMGGALLISNNQENRYASASEAVLEGVVTVMDYTLAGAATVECVATLGVGCAVDAGLEYGMDKAIEVGAPVVVPVANQVIEWGSQKIETVASGVNVVVDEAGKQLQKRVGTRLNEAFQVPKEAVEAAANRTPWDSWPKLSP